MKLIVTSLMLLSTVAFGGELDNEKQITNVTERAKDLPATLIMRKNEKTGEVEVVHLKQAVGEKQLSESELNQMNFTAVAMNEKYSEQKFNELDTDNSRESWYFYYGYYGYYGYPYYYYPSYYYYGAYYPYYPYYNYYWGGYNYYYYRPCCW